MGYPSRKRGQGNYQVERQETEEGLGQAEEATRGVFAGYPRRWG
jgi:hypothetical protein